MHFSVAALTLLKVIGVGGSVMVRAHALSPSPSPGPSERGRTNATNDNTNANKHGHGLRKANVNGAIPSDQRILQYTNIYYFAKVGDGQCVDSSDLLLSWIAQTDTTLGCAPLFKGGFGTGEIDGVNGNTNFECWKVADPPQPSSQPQPSEQPSSQPSESPSSDPSESPSSEPSSDPSLEPSPETSSEPSSMPSCSPSSSPTESPSTKYGVNMFYPIWEQNYNGCRNDGLEPDFMAVNPTDWLSSTNEACCSKFFNGFLYDACIGRYPPDHDDCNKALFYPDWSGSNEGCLGDGREPYYMTANADFFLVDSLEKCCKKYYNWNYYQCTGTRPVLTNGEYYPDWTGGSSSYCLNDDKMPEYMLNNQKWYLSTTLEKCCEKHFRYEMNECMGTTNAGTNEWYVNYADKTCYQDCSGAAPCGGVVNFWVDTFDTKEQCCKEELNWYPLKKCLYH